MVLDFLNIKKKVGRFWLLLVFIITINYMIKIIAEDLVPTAIIICIIIERIFFK